MAINPQELEGKAQGKHKKIRLNFIAKFRRIDKLLEAQREIDYGALKSSERCRVDMASITLGGFVPVTPPVGATSEL